MLEGKVIKTVGGFFYLAHDGKIIAAKIRKKLSYNNKEVCVGDDVGFCYDQYHRAIVEEVYPEKNRLLRPTVANVDVAVIVVASVPQPDLVLVDKIILNCVSAGITPVIALNKCDINPDGFDDEIKKQYKTVVADVLSVSAEQNINLSALKQTFEGKTCVFCGQSAVGKTSLLNKFAEKAQKTGEVSQKSGRGKHTTRHSQMFFLDGGTFIIDTPGFSLLELTGIKSSELCLYYGDMAELQNKCKFHTCTHTTEPECYVKKCVDEGSFDKNRYERYLTIFKELKEAEKNRF